MKIHAAYFAFNCLVAFVFYSDINNKEQTIIRLKERAIAEKVAAWSTSASGKKEFVWLSDIFAQK